jgi:death-on-curing protein
MKEPEWLGEDILRQIQTELLAQFGGLEGVRDDGLLDSALNQPIQLVSYGTPDLYALAASYTYGIVRNHPFLDGNKRAGLMAAYAFLGLNGIHLSVAEEEAVIMTVDLAAGKIEAAVYAEWLRQHCEPLQD